MPDWLLGLIEVALGVATYLAADLFWQCRNRNRFYQYGLQNYPFLKKEISWDKLRKSTRFVDLMLSKGQKDYPIVILTALQSDRATSRKVLWRLGGVLGALLAVSLILPIWAVVINFCVIFLARSEKLTEPARDNAMAQIQTLVFILSSWWREDQEACESWVAQVGPLQTLFEVVKQAYDPLKEELQDCMSEDTP